MCKKIAYRIDSMNLLSERIEHILETTGISASDIARRVGVTSSTISQWKSGQTTNIRPDHLFALAELTGFEAKWIGTGKGPERPPEAINHRASELLQNYLRCDERGRVTLLAVAEREASCSSKDTA